MECFPKTEWQLCYLSEFSEYIENFTKEYCENI